jgi:apolipoprotein D and lipocalin family protein
MQLVGVVALAAGGAALVTHTLSAQQQALQVVPQVDFERYSGKWFEIARLPFRYQENCVGDVTATYTPRPDGRITVVNSCREADGNVNVAEGVARRVDGKPPSVLKVRFAPGWLSFLPMVWGDYQIIELGADYDYAVVGTPERKNLWILARKPKLEPELHRSLVDKARAQGFDVSRLIQTTQSGA